jgi:adenine-specific DNA-methyltransferase
MSPDRDIPSYASTRLIAYIGNKRALLPFLSEVFLELDGEKPISVFLDPFAGSGAVSRLARSRGWSVMSCDAEEYSRAVNEAWLGVSADELPSLFAAEGGLPAVLVSLNDLHPERGDAVPDCPVEPYIALHYAPASTKDADWRRERLFYTRENAVFLDRARCAIEHMRPAESGTVATHGSQAERALLIGLLVYEAATHSNTSGVFKGYHKGFGGHGRDNLNRILAPMSLEAPELWPGKPAEVRREDAAAFCAGRPADLCYLDPPYNQHQYGSNYHLLNTIARWDRPTIDDERTADGSLLRAAGIPPGWKQSKSAFCRKMSAGVAFRDLLASVDARFVLLSYNTEGLVAADELCEMMADRADLSLRSVDYVKYRGGRQSVSRRSKNREILFVARRREGRGRPSAESGGPNAELTRLKSDLRLARALAGPFDPGRFAALCGGGETLRFESGGRSVELPSFRGLVLEEGAGEACAILSPEEKEALAASLEPALLEDNAAACAAATGIIEEGACESRLQALALGWLRKLAHRGYERDFRALSSRLSAAALSGGNRLSRLSERISEIEALFAARMEDRRRYREIPERTETEQSAELLEALGSMSTPSPY